MPIDEERWEIVRGAGPEDSFIELWDRLLAPGGLAVEVVQPSKGARLVNDYGVAPPIEVRNEFLALADRYLSPPEAEQSAVHDRT